MMLMLIGMDANNNIIWQANAINLLENADNCAWFVQKYEESCLVVVEVPFFTDCGSGII
jgi:hypothetical protein